MKPILIISDLHLSESHPETLALFEYFMQTIALEADTLFILGDLFDVWMGDDTKTPSICQTLKLLADYAQSGRKIFVIRGNRDFLLGRNFERESQSKLLGDYVVLDQAGTEWSAIKKNIILMHGDLLCTSDRRYQLFRKIVHQNWVQRLFLSMPLSWRRRIANKLRAASQSYGASTFQQRPEILDASPQGIANVRKQFNPSYLIHGHTHRLNIHREDSFTRVVLGDWHAQGSFASLTAEGLQLFTFDSMKRQLIGSLELPK